MEEKTWVSKKHGTNTLAEQKISRDKSPPEQVDRQSQSSIAYMKEKEEIQQPSKNQLVKNNLKLWVLKVMK